MELMTGIFTWVQYHEMPPAINVRYLTRYVLQNVKYLTYHDMSTKCQVSCLEMLGTYLITAIHETVRY